MNSFEVDLATSIQGGKSILILSLKGHLDAAAVPELEKKVSQLIEGGSDLLVFSFKAIDYVSSSGLGLLLAAHRRLERQGGRICLAEVSEEVLHIMDVLGFNRIIRIFPTVDSAVQAVVSG